jgi:Family of unknown function (DUF6496)
VLAWRFDRALGTLPDHASAGVDLALRPLNELDQEAFQMARYGRKASKTVESAMRRRKRGTLESSRNGKKVTSRKQAIAIGLSEARKKARKFPASGIAAPPAAGRRPRDPQRYPPGSWLTVGQNCGS